MGHVFYYFPLEQELAVLFTTPELGKWLSNVLLQSGNQFINQYVNKCKYSNII